MVDSKRIVLDTNFLLIPAQFNVDIFTEVQRICDFPYELHIIETTLKELENIMEKSEGKAKQAAKLALGLVKAKDINIMSSDVAYVDKAILDIVDENTIVATMDRELREKLKNKGVRLITLRQKKYLTLEA